MLDAERKFKSRIDRLMRFVDPQRWQPSRANEENIWRWVRLLGGRVRITVFLKENRYGVYFAPEGGKGICHPDRLASQREAIELAFNFIEDIKR
jgi:hypothetical protein